MKGVLLAGGTGSRLYPLTKVTNKHLLPVYNKPMIYYPLFSMKEAGITEVMLISGRNHSGDFSNLLGSGLDLGLKITYGVQDEAGGIAQALGLAEKFVGDEKCLVILGDNIFENSIGDYVRTFENSEFGAHIILTRVQNPRSYGVATIEGDRVVEIVEKPSEPKSDLAVAGCYMFKPDVFDVIKTLKPSARNELEITDVNNYFLSKESLSFSLLDGFWGDCGESFDSLLKSSELVRDSRLSGINNDLTI